MATTRVNKLNMGSNGTAPSFNGGVCDCAIVKIAAPTTGATAVTYGGFAMIKFAEILDNASFVHQVWGLQDAPQGTVTVNITGGGAPLISSIESYSGVNTTATFPNTSGTAEHHLGSGSLTDIQVDVTTTEDDCILVGLGGYRGSGLTSMSPGTNTALISVNPPGGGDDLSVESNPLVTGPAGVYHLAGTTGGGSIGIVISLIVVALTPGPAATPSFIPQTIII